MFFPRLQREIRCGIAICMDINWKDFEPSLSETRKLADFQVANRTQMLIWLTAWCNPEPHYQCQDESRDTCETNNYWVDRLFPIALSKHQNPEPFYYVACNRIGTEKTILFLGSSVVVKLRPQLSYVGQPASLKSQEVVRATLNF